MSKTVKFKRGNANVSTTYVGAQGEITVNTDNYTLNVHDGQTPGGFRILNTTIGNIGNLVVADQTISGTRSETNITISPLGANTVINSRVFTPNVVIDQYTIRSVSGNTSLTLPTESNGVDVELTNSFSNIKLTTFDTSTNVPYTLILDTDSYLTIPGSIKSNVGGAEIQFAGGQGLLFYSNFATGHTGISLDDNLTEIFSNSNVVITTDGSNVGNQWHFDRNGSMLFPDSTTQTTAWAGGRVVSVPNTSTGAMGDLQSDIAFSNGYIYYCTANYTDGLSNIWKRVAWSGDTW